MIFSLILALAAAQAPLDPIEKDEAYQSLLHCSAFHTIEYNRAEGDAVEAQRAIATDFALSAIPFAVDGKKETVDADLMAILTIFDKKFADGDIREIAEGWTALERECRELYPVRDVLFAESALKPADDAER